MNIKKLGFVSALTLIGVMSTTAYSVTTLKEQADVNGDGRINSIDMALLQRRVAGYPNNIGREDRGDLNCDNNVGTLDLSLLQRYVAGFDMTAQAKACARKLPPTLPIVGAGDYVPSNCSITEQEGEGKKIYACYNSSYKDNLNYYVLKVNLELADVSFGNVIKYGTKNAHGHNLYYTRSLSLWRRIAGYPFATINGQFFNNKIDEPTTLSFPVKSNGININTYSENERTKTLSISYGGTPKINYGYYNLWTDKELIVGLNPNVNKNKYLLLGRNYIGVKDKEIYFFISDASTQGIMENRIEKWGISLDDTIMMDGSGSAQLITKDVSYYGVSGLFGGKDKRKLPNVITIK